MYIRAIFVITALFCGSFGIFSFAVANEELCNSVCKKMQEIKERSNNVVLIYAFGSKGASSGTGTVISTAEGNTYILTNNHVVEGASSGRVWVVFESGKKEEVAVIGRDPAADLALLQSPELPPGATPVIFGRELKIGQQVYALGYPFGMRSVTFGYINALEPTLTWPFIWTQTPINPGNSGGPLFNEKREMVGVNTAVVPVNIAVGGGISLVIPIDHVKRLLPRLTLERVVRHGVVGFELDDSARILPVFFDKYGLRYPPEREGIMVTVVVPGLPAAQANIKVGDIVLKWKGVSFRKALDLKAKIFFDHRPGEEVTITLQRDGQIFERRVLLSEHTRPKAEEGTQ
ncbi:MAG: trypsin-like peptidase domain-containing protein [bacterium]|nr:trypsin-like peptidase domain-containing protein [bacterium]